MRLYSQQGYKETSVAPDRVRPGLAAGAGALDHLRKFKEAVLEAGIDRQLDRRLAMQDVRAMFAGKRERLLAGREQTAASQRRGS